MLFHSNFLSPEKMMSGLRSIVASRPTSACDPNDIECKINKYARYSPEKSLSIQITYIIGVLAWIFLIYITGLYETNLLGLLILAIPIFVFGFGFVSARHLTVELEECLFSANSLSIGLVILLPLLTELDKTYNKNKQLFTRAILIAIVLAMFSLLDVWVQPKYLSITKHVKSILQTASLTLLIYALYSYYTGRAESLI
jgi:hypothetical protein